MLPVIQARNVSQIGVEGVLISESERTFQLATAPHGDLATINSSVHGSETINSSDKHPRIITVPKPHTVFVFRWADRLITIYGNHFVQRSADRSAKKYAKLINVPRSRVIFRFKGKDTIEL
jgi:RNase P/RNase MRP subunit p29